MQKIFVSFTLMLLNTICLAQVTLNGRIVNADEAPISSATIELFGSQQQTNSFTADENGFYQLKNLTAGEKYLLQISAVGYLNQAISIVLQKDSILNITLLSNNTTLQNVTVTSRAKLLEVKSDRTVINLADNIAIVGNSVTEALAKIPGIQISSDQVMIPGKGSVQLMIDGRLLQLSQKELFNYLKTIPVGTVSKIEIITNPSAAYDAAGNAGLINIITKRNTQAGYSGSLQAGYKHWQQYPGADITGNINYNSGKWNLYANGNFFHIQHAYGFRWESDYSNRSWAMSDTGDYKQSNLSFNAGADYQISSKSNFGVNAGYSRYIEDGFDHVRSPFYNAAGQTDSVLTSLASYIPVAKTQSYGIYYKTKFDTTGKTFSTDASYINFYRTDKSVYKPQSYIPGNPPIVKQGQPYTYDALQNINIFALRADFELPTTFAKLQLGAKTNFIETDVNTFYYAMHDAGNQYDPSLSVAYNYKENTQAAYVNAQRDINKWSVQAGLRAERTQTKGRSLLQDQVYNNRYLKFYPNFLINLKANRLNAYSFSYTKRINRPTFWNLNPFKSLLTSNSFYEGNPYLQPEYISNFQLQHIYKNKLTTGLYASITNNGFADITIAYEDTNAVLRTPKNFANSTRIGISETYSFSKIRWWESNNLLNIYYTDGRSKLDYIENRSGWGAYFSTSNNFYFNPGRTLSGAVNFWYQFPEVSLVNQSDPYYSLDLGLNAVLINDKLSVNASVQDVFGSSAPSYTNTINGVTQKYSVLQLNRNYSLTFIFKFGKKEIKAIEHSNSTEEERSRM